MSKLSENDKGVICLIALGSNLNDPVIQVQKSIKSLGELGKLLDHSSLYSSPALTGGPKGQSDYVNAVARLETFIGPDELLRELKAIEIRQGRFTVEKWGPRIIDLDIIDYGGQIISSGKLEIPHKETMNRPFVLQPILDLEPEWAHPVSGEKASSALQKLRPFVLKKLKV